MIKSCYLLCCLLSYHSLMGQTDSSKSKDLSEVVVTGQYHPQSARNSVYQVRTISKERIQKQGAAKLQDVLNNELNIRFSQDLATGGSTITMLGLRGQNVKILIDGLPLTGRQGTSNEININQIDVHTIERIEIIEGPMSVVYGADALAGVINIITKKAGNDKLLVFARLHEESAGNEYGIKQGIHNQTAGVTWRYNKNWQAGGGITHNYFGGWKDTAVERELVWHKKSQLLSNGFIAFQKGKFHARYRIDGLNETITNPGNFLFPQLSSGDTLANDQQYITSRVMHQLHGTYTAASRLNIQLQTSYTNYNRQVFSTTVNKKNGNVRLNTAPGSQSTIDFDGLTVRGIAAYKLSDLVSFQPGIDINRESGKGERLAAGTSVISDYAFFITTEITPSEKINIRPGVRLIHNSVYKAPPFIPSINTKFIILKNFDFRLAYARGFRSPSLRELYFNFFDANHQVTGNPNLKAETSNSFTGSLNWKKNIPNETVYSFSLGGFYNDVKNLIDYGVSSADPNNFTLLNVSDSKTAGMNINANGKFRKWDITTGASYTGFYNDFSERDDKLPVMNWSPEFNLIIGYNFAKIGLDMGCFYKFTGRRPFYVTKEQSSVLSVTEGYHMADVTANKKINKSFSINAGVRNLFNVDRINSTVSGSGIHSAEGTRNIASGRSFFAGISFTYARK